MLFSGSKNDPFGPIFGKWDIFSKINFNHFFSFAASYLHTHFPKYWSSGYWVISANRTDGRTDGQTKVNLLVLSILQRRTNNDTQMVSWKCFYPQLYIHETPIFVENMTKNAFLGILRTSIFIFFGLWNQKLKYLIFSSFKSIICCTKYLINSES